MLPAMGKKVEQNLDRRDSKPITKSFQTKIMKGLFDRFKLKN